MHGSSCNFSSVFGGGSHLAKYSRLAQKHQETGDAFHMAFSKIYSFSPVFLRVHWATHPYKFNCSYKKQ